MKKTILMILFSSVVTAFLSCDDDITSPQREVAIEISERLLSGYFVTATAFDSKGTAWVGTFKQGLIKYDGGMTIYNSSNSSLPDSLVVLDIEVDHDDHVWIGSDVGLLKFDGSKFHLYNTSNSPLAVNVVWSVAVDQDNVLWLASCRFRQGGLMKFDGKNWSLYTPDNSALSTHCVRDVAVDSRNHIWLTLNETVGNGCLVRIAGDNWKIFDADEIGFAPYYFGDLVIDKNNKIYAALDYGLSSLHDMTRPNLIVYDGDKWTIQNPEDENGESLGYVGKIATDLYGNVWASVHGREKVCLAVFNGQKWIYNQPEFPIDWVSELAVDRSNDIWVGTGEGVYVIAQE